jgi:hypothetical protein
MNIKYNKDNIMKMILMFISGFLLGLSLCIHIINDKSFSITHYHKNTKDELKWVTVLTNSVNFQQGRRDEEN